MMNFVCMLTGAKETLLCVIFNFNNRSGEESRDIDIVERELNSIMYIYIM